MSEGEMMIEWIRKYNYSADWFHFVYNHWLLSSNRYGKVSANIFPKNGGRFVDSSPILSDDSSLSDEDRISLILEWGTKTIQGILSKFKNFEDQEFLTQHIKEKLPMLLERHLVLLQLGYIIYNIHEDNVYYKSPETCAIYSYHKLDFTELKGQPIETENLLEKFDDQKREVLIWNLDLFRND